MNRLVVSQQLDDLQLLTEWRVPGEERRTLRAGVISVAVHVVAFVVVLSLPPSAFTPPARPAARVAVTPLVAPPRELTQRDPNRAPIGHEFDLQALMPRPAVVPRVSPPSSTQPAARERAAAPAVVPMRAEPAVSEPAAMLPPPTLSPGQDRLAHAPAFGSSPDAPPPLPPVAEKPKLAFEKPGSSMGSPTGTGSGIAIQRPNSSIQEVIRGAAPGSSHGGVAVGDLGEGIGGLGSMQGMPPSPPKMGSNVELLSDPMGVDFRPYLTRLLAAVRRNWLAVIPEAARLGQPGKVVVQFAVARDGRVVKLVFAREAGPGAQALDRAAVASISASDPFPPLPPEFKGNQVRLQLAFLYNLPTR